MFVQEFGYQLCDFVTGTVFTDVNFTDTVNSINLDDLYADIVSKAADQVCFLKVNVL